MGRNLKTKTKSFKENTFVIQKLNFLYNVFTGKTKLSVSITVENRRLYKKFALQFIKFNFKFENAMACMITHYCNRIEIRFVIRSICFWLVLQKKRTFLCTLRSRNNKRN